MKTIFELYGYIQDLNEIHEDLQRELRKCESKFQQSKRDKLLTALKEERMEYQKDTILLIEGLLQTKGDYYNLLKTQLDEQYSQFIKEKLIAISKLINMNEKVFIDENKIKIKINNYLQSFNNIVEKL